MFTGLTYRHNISKRVSFLQYHLINMITTRLPWHSIYQHDYYYVALTFSLPTWLLLFCPDILFTNMITTMFPWYFIYQHDYCYVALMLYLPTWLLLCCTYILFTNMLTIILPWHSVYQHDYYYFFLDILFTNMITTM